MSIETRSVAGTPPRRGGRNQSVYGRYQRRIRGGAQCSRFHRNSTTALNRFTHIAFLISLQVVVGANETGPGRWTNEEEPVIQNIDNTPNVYIYVYIYIYFFLSFQICETKCFFFSLLGSFKCFVKTSKFLCHTYGKFKAGAS